VTIFTTRSYEMTINERSGAPLLQRKMLSDNKGLEFEKRPGSDRKEPNSEPTRVSVKLLLFECDGTTFFSVLSFWKLLEIGLVKS
jgi:hypothetical protein